MSIEEERTDGIEAPGPSQERERRLSFTVDDLGLDPRHVAHAREEVFALLASRTADVALDPDLLGVERLARRRYRATASAARSIAAGSERSSLVDALP